jgi:flagellar motor switch protein FliM
MRYKRKNKKKLSKKKDDSEDYPTEVLSQNEIDVLLTAIGKDNTEPENGIPIPKKYHSTYEFTAIKKELEELKEDYKKFKSYLEDLIK